MVRQYDAQKFIGESRAPRVQIEYDVEVYGSQKKVELPFVVGVLADLSGDNDEARSVIEERKFVSFDTENFDERMQQILPILQLQVPNTLTNDGTVIDADLEFRSIEDFEPAKLVRRIPELATLLEARDRLKELIMYMDGKATAEEVVEELLRRTSAELDHVVGADETQSASQEGEEDAAQKADGEGQQ